MLDSVAYADMTNFGSGDLGTMTGTISFYGSGTNTWYFRCEDRYGNNASISKTVTQRRTQTAGAVAAGVALVTIGEQDVGQALSLWSFRHGLEKHWDDVFNEFLRGYNSTSPHKIEINSSLYKWICFGCLSDASTFFADLVRGENWPQEGEKIKRIFQCRSYQKFLYFKTLIN